MKGKHYLPIILVCACVILLSLGVGFSAAATQECEIAMIGQYKLTESQFKEYSLLSSLEKGTSNNLALTAQMYAKTQIAAEEVSGTPYDISPNYKEELRAQETINFQRDYEINMEFCKQLGITKEELINAVVTSKMNILIQGKHFSLVVERILETEQKNSKTTNYSSNDLLAIYNEYMNNKIEGLNLVVIDADRVRAVESHMMIFKSRLQETSML